MLPNIKNVYVIAAMLPNIVSDQFVSVTFRKEETN